MSVTGFTDTVVYPPTGSTAKDREMSTQSPHLSFLWGVAQFTLPYTQPTQNNVVDCGVLQAMWEEAVGRVVHRDQLIIC